AMEVSHSGVSMTRQGPNLSCRPTVARNTPPLTPTSSPSTTTLSSCAISQASACVTASMRVISATAHLPGDGEGALLCKFQRHVGVQVIEHGFHRLCTRVEVGVDLLVHARLAFGLPGLLLCIAPRAQTRQVGTQAADGLAL